MYYSIGQAQKKEEDFLIWEAGNHPSKDQFMNSVKSAVQLLDAGNFAAAQGPLRKAIDIRSAFTTPTHRREADRFLFKIIDPKLSVYGIKLKYSGIKDTITIEKILPREDLVGSLPTILLSIVVVGGFLAGGYLLYKRL